jgi:hypothetical protein
MVTKLGADQWMASYSPLKQRLMPALITWTFGAFQATITQ